VLVGLSDSSSGGTDRVLIDMGRVAGPPTCVWGVVECWEGRPYGVRFTSPHPPSYSPNPPIHPCTVLTRTPTHPPNTHKNKNTECQEDYEGIEINRQQRRQKGVA
jgi:hypothetical protein